MGRQRQTDRQTSTLLFIISLMLLQSCMKSVWFLVWYRAQTSREMSDPSQLVQMYAISVPQLLITSGMWQRRKDILTMILCTLTIKFPRPLYYRLGCIFDHEKRWETIYSLSLRAGISNERTIALHVPSRDCRAVAQCSALMQAPRASKGEKGLHPVCSCWTCCRVTLATETSVSVIISHYHERQTGINTKELPQSHSVSERHLGAFGKFTWTICFTSPV